MLATEERAGREQSPCGMLAAGVMLRSHVPWTWLHGSSCEYLRARSSPGTKYP